MCTITQDSFKIPIRWLLKPECTCVLGYSNSPKCVTLYWCVFHFIPRPSVLQATAVRVAAKLLSSSLSVSFARAFGPVTPKGVGAVASILPKSIFVFRAEMQRQIDRGKLRKLQGSRSINKSKGAWKQQQPWCPEQARSFPWAVLLHLLLLLICIADLKPRYPPPHLSLSLSPSHVHTHTNQCSLYTNSWYLLMEVNYSLSLGAPVQIEKKEKKKTPDNKQ